MFSRRFAVATLGLLLCLGDFASAAPRQGKSIPIYVALHWHMHQPIYWPGEDIVATSRNPKNTVDVLGILSWPDRIGAYTHYPVAAMRPFLDLPYAGTQVSFSGSLIEDLDAMAASGITYGRDWAKEARDARQWRTSKGNPRLDLVAFGYHHPLMAFLEYGEIRRQIADHREAIQRTFGGPVSKGIFPPENAFALPMVPALVDEGIEWVLVDNIHMDRASRGYPYSAEQKIPPPNASDQLNRPQPAYVSVHSQTNTVQAVGGVGLRPHWVEYRDPATGQAVTPAGKPARMLVVPTERSIGYDDSYGDRSPISRLGDLEALNTDPAHPLLVVLAHDGDNFGASGSRYYLETLGWVRQNPDKYVLTTIQDYVDRFPPAPADTIHVEDGSWAGADLGDATFTKWLGPPYRGTTIDPERGWSSDWDSWAATVAARNWVNTAKALAPAHSATKRAERFAMVGVTSCYWYWDGTHEWDAKPTLAANEAVRAARAAVGREFDDTVAPSVFPPQRFPYNPSGPSPFTVYTLAYDAGQLASITLKARRHSGADARPSDFTYEGDWESLAMKPAPMQGTPATSAVAKAERYAARLTAPASSTVVYFVEAVDARGNVGRSVVKRAFVGAAGDGGEVSWSPPFPNDSDSIVVTAPRDATLHWGVNGWQLPPRGLWPAGTTAWADGKAVETPMKRRPDGRWAVTLGPTQGHSVGRIDFVWHFADGTWGRDQAILVTDQMQAWRDLDARSAGHAAERTQKRR